jgi:hypothetical protein
MVLPPFQGIRRKRISRRTLTTKVEQLNIDYIICKLEQCPRAAADEQNMFNSKI